MGDRANVVIKTADEQVCLYTHWNGHSLPEVLSSALSEGRGRWTDAQYLARIVFCRMVGPAEWDETTGFGISQSVYDGGDRVLTVDVDRQTVQVQDQPPIPFAQYIETEERIWHE